MVKALQVTPRLNRLSLISMPNALSTHKKDFFTLARVYTRNQELYSLQLS
jgi:hypothetical protein